MFQTLLALFWGEAGGGRICGQGTRSTWVEVSTDPPLPVQPPPPGLMRYETDETKGPVFHSSKVFVNFVTATSLLDWEKLVLKSSFQRWGSRRFSCFAVNGFCRAPGQLSPLSVDTFTSFASGSCKEGEGQNLNRYKVSEEA